MPKYSCYSRRRFVNWSVSWNWYLVIFHGTLFLLNNKLATVIQKCLLFSKWTIFVFKENSLDSISWGFLFLFFWFLLFKIYLQGWGGAIENSCDFLKCDKIQPHLRDLNKLANYVFQKNTAEYCKLIHGWEVQRKIMTRF